MSEVFLFLIELAPEITVGYNFSSCYKLKAKCRFTEVAIFFTCLFKAAQYLFHEVL